MPARAGQTAGMKIMLNLLAGLALLVLLLVAVAYLLPREYRVERAAVIRAPLPAVHAQLADLRAWNRWSVWHQRDPGMACTYSPAQGVVGAWSKWESRTEGNGMATLTEVSPQRIVYRLEFADYGMQSAGSFELTPQPNGVRVVWASTGDLGRNPLSRWFGLFLDRMIGPDFEAGLARLKRNLES